MFEALGRRPGWGSFAVRLSGSHPAFRVIERMISLRSRLSGIATGDQAIFVARDLFLAAGGFADISLLEDVELCRRLRRIVRPVRPREPVVTSSRRWEEAGIARHDGAHVVDPGGLRARGRARPAGPSLPVRKRLGE